MQRSGRVFVDFGDERWASEREQPPLLLVRRANCQFNVDRELHFQTVDQSLRGRPVQFAFARGKWIGGRRLHDAVGGCHLQSSLIAGNSMQQKCMQYVFLFYY
jgi:hypothetical protein